MIIKKLFFFLNMSICTVHIFAAENSEVAVVSSSSSSARRPLAERQIEGGEASGALPSLESSSLNGKTKLSFVRCIFS
jgi:hypothetical protein